jgi:uncharacterized membrane protein YgcG
MMATGMANPQHNPTPRDPETKMAKALEDLRANPVFIPEGYDDRCENLHPARFLGGAVIAQQKKWHIARQLYGLGGVTAITGFDFDTLGIAGCITTRGIVEMQNPANPHLKLKFFSSTNVGSSALSSRRLTLADGDQAIDINESLRDLVTMDDFKMALMNASKAMHIIFPWNHTIDMLEVFFAHNNHCVEKTGHLSDRAAELTAFVDHVFHTNSRKWVNDQDFLDATTLPAAFASWIGSRPAGRVAAAAAMRVTDGKNDGGAAKRKNRGNRGQGGGSYGGSSSSYTGSGASASGGNSGSQNRPELCRWFNLGMCKNPKHGCTAGLNGTGHKLLHECSHKNSSGRLCRGNHPEIHHK